MRTGRAAAPRAVMSLVALVMALVSLWQGAAGGGGAGTVPAARQAKNVAVITIRGDEPMDNDTYASFVRRLRVAERGGADAVVVELDTPGGEVGAVLKITAALKDSRIANTVAWVNPRAYSGGAVIAWACREIVVSPNASLGDALPITFDFKTRQWKVIRGDMLKKMLPPLMADLVESARKYGRDEYLVQALCNDTVELWLLKEKATGRLLCVDAEEYRRVFGEAPARGLPYLAAFSPNRPGETSAGGGGRDGTPAASPEPAPSSDTEYKPASPQLGPIAESVDMHLEKRGAAAVSTRPVLGAADRDKWELVTYLTNGTGPIVLKTADAQFLGVAAATIANDEELKAFLGAGHLTRLEPSWSEGLVAFLSSLWVKGILVAVFLLAMFIEMTHPGTMLPGAVAFVALVGLVAPPLLVNLSAWWAVGAILVGIVLIVLEVLVIPGFGVFGVVGLLLLFGGLIGVMVPTASLFPDTAGERQDLLYGVMTLTLALATSCTGMYFVAKHFKSLPLFNRLVLQDPVWDDGTPRDELLAAMADVGGPVKKGVVGVVMTPLRPAGRVEVVGAGGTGARIIDVVSETGYIPSGVRVRVVSVSDFRIGVERLDEPPLPPAAGERSA